MQAGDITNLLLWFLWAVALPLALAVLVALPLWVKRRVIAGNVVGSVAVAMVIFVLIWQQYGMFAQSQASCTATGAGCISGLTMYTPYLYLVLVGWLDVFVLLIVSGVVEDRQRRRRLDRSRL
jgi:hypothetical protein